MPISRLVCSLLVALIWASTARAQASRVQFDRLGAEDGLSTSTVASLLQDRTGYLWVGTELGLDRYDGYGFTSFRHDPADPASLSSSFAAALAEDASGDLWVGTYGGGLNRLDPRTGRAVRFRHDSTDAASLADDRVEALLVGPSGVLWVGTGDGVDRLDPATGRIRHFGAALRLGGDAAYVRDLAMARGGRLWVGSQLGLFLLDPRSGRARRRLGVDDVVALHADADGTLWVGFGNDGLARIDGRTGAVRRFRHDAADAGSLCSDVVQDVTRDRRGALWVATRGGGVCRLGAGARFTTHRTGADRHSLSTDAARVLLADRGGLLWVGTWAGGLNRMRQTPFELFRATPDDGFRSPDVMSFADAGQGRMWVGTFDAGLVLTDARGRAVPQPSMPAVLRSAGVRALLTDRDGALWATGDAGGLWRRDAAGQWSRAPLPGAVRGVLDLALGPDGTIWVAAYGPGLCRVDRGAFAVVCPPVPGGLSGTEGYAVFPNADGTVWLSLWGVGVDLVHPVRGRLAHYENDSDRPESLSQNSVTSFARDALGRLWMGTYGGGLEHFIPGARLGGGRFEHVGLAAGLPDATVYAVLPDAEGAFWLTTNRGLARFDPLYRGVETYGMDDGLQGDEFNTGAALRLADGRLVVGGTQGYNRFDAGAVRASGPVPAVAVTALRVMGQPRDLPAGDLVLDYAETAVAFEFAALDFADPSRNQFLYRLEGLDARWTRAGTRREAAYTNLAPGRYTLRVRGASSDGAWGETAFAFRIRPAWWQTWAFRTAALLAILAALVALVRYVSQRRLRADIARLDAERRLQDERARISRDLHDHVGAQLSSLLAGVEVARLARRGGAEAGAEALAGVEADARETMVQLRESIWALHEGSVTLGALRDRIDADVRARARGANRLQTSVTLDGPAEAPLGPEQALHLFRIAREAITNSLKHAGAARLDVRVAHDGETITVEVCDDGRFRAPGGDGAAPVAEARTPSVGISGFGMDSMRTRASALGGRLDVETRDGTTVRVTVPAAGAPSDRAA